MPTYRVSVQAVITEIVEVHASDADEAKSIALKEFTATGQPPQTYQAWVEECIELRPKWDNESVRVVDARGYTEDELCKAHDMPFAMVGGKKVCPRCVGAYGFTD